MNSPLPTDQLINDLQQLGVQSGSVLVVHTSLRNVGWVSDGPAAVIEALRSVLGPAGTLVMPTMTNFETLYDPLTTPTKHMGIVAETFWRMEGVLRSGHPSGSFAAAGPLAAQITAPQPIDPPHGIDSP
ncbi:MAG: AAC(3) family N-acetyltransferase, partial [Caldilineaceae bacterium]|nr:AAC(3) family N-acetyltransferase [Caldilineaceae bacterium]MCB0143317.1 AAC(3) family N-acetyltransferase [Caldilineaceae bacterium]